MEPEQINAPQVPAKPKLKDEIAVAIADHDVADKVMVSINNLVVRGQLSFPKSYNVGNEAKLAYMRIAQNAELAGCAPASIAQSIVDTLIQGLEVEKNQVYYIKFGTKCQMFRSYFGDASVTYRSGLVKDIKAMVVKDKDEFEIESKDDEVIVAHHKTCFANIDNPIVAAYAVAVMADGTKRYCVMSKKEIDASWNQSKSNARTTQKVFPQEMAKRTVIRRLVKIIFNTANTPDNFVNTIIASYNRTTEDEYENAPKESPTAVDNNLVPDDADDDGVVEDLPEVSDDTASRPDADTSKETK